jgi:hypothetical protein
MDMFYEARPYVVKASLFVIHFKDVYRRTGLV